MERLIEGSVIPVFCQRHSLEYVHVGSAVLMFVSNKHMLLTAAHVVAWQARGVIWVGGAPNVRLSEVVLSTCQLVPEEARGDSVDLAIVFLTGEQAESIKAGGAHFLEADDLEMGSTRSYPCNAIAVGFSEEFVEIDDSTHLSRSTPVVLHSQLLSDEKIARHASSLRREMDPAKQLCVSYEGRPKDRNGKPMNGRPSARCMSGGGIWLETGGRRRLAGVIIEFYPSRCLLVGTRLWMILPMIAKILRGH